MFDDDEGSAGGDALTCPFCGEPLDLDLEEDVAGVLVQDCAVCCNPLQLTVRRSGGETSIRVERAD